MKRIDLLYARHRRAWDQAYIAAALETPVQLIHT